MGQFARDGVALSSYVLFFIQRKGNHSQNRVYSPSTLRSLHLINAVQHLARSVNDMNQQTDLLILDFSKAFDKVAHKRLLLKLEYYDIRGLVSPWIKVWLIGRTQQVVLEGVCSGMANWKNSTGGPWRRVQWEVLREIRSPTRNSVGSLVLLVIR